MGVILFMIAPDTLKYDLTNTYIFNLIIEKTPVKRLQLTVSGGAISPGAACASWALE